MCKAITMKNLICPFSPLRVDENIVRFTALWVVLLLGLTMIYPNYYIPMYLVLDFYIRAFTKAKFSPLSWVSYQFVKSLKLKTVLIDKAPKIFAARIGFSLTTLMSISALMGFNIAMVTIASVLMLFAFLECGINFCAGCWLYTYIVLPIYKNK